MRTIHEVKIALNKAGIEAEKNVNGVLTFNVGFKKFSLARNWAMMNGTQVDPETLISRVVFSNPVQRLPGNKTNVGNPRAKGPHIEIPGKKRVKESKKGGRRKTKHY